MNHYSSRREDEIVEQRRSRARKLAYEMFPQLRSPFPDDPVDQDDFTTRDNAAKALNVSERTVYRYLREGKLRPYVRGATHGVRTEDVQALLHPEDEGGTPPVNRRTLARMHREICELREVLERCREALNLRWTPLDLSAAELVRLYDEARLFFPESCQLRDVETWGTRLVRMRERDLALIEQGTSEPHPWIPFCALVGGLGGCVSEKQLPTRLAGLVSAAQQNINTLSYIWIVKKEGELRMEKLAKKLAAR
jgi:excisionase family DNA binding protein